MAFGKDGGPDIRRRARMNYPERARRQGRQGRVLVLVHLDARGRVVDARIKSGVGADLDRAALEFARRCTYSPAVSQGQGVACRAVLPVTFRLRE